MTRQEEIIEASKEYSLNRFNIRPDVVQDCFIEGAKWADKTMLEKACKWLEDIDFDGEYFRDAEDFFSNEVFIIEFRKAMEE